MKPTAALDIESELAVQKKRSITCLQPDGDYHRSPFIHHRRAGNILVIEEGQVVEQGPHAQLLSHHGRYQALWRRKWPRAWRDDGVSASGEWGA